MHLITLHFIGEIFGIPENVPRFLKNVFHIPDERQLGLASCWRQMAIENTICSLFYLRSSIVKSVFYCDIPGVYMHGFKFSGLFLNSGF